MTIFRKPQRWSVQPGLAHPKWSWFWRSLKGGSGLLEGGGTPRDIITGEAWNMDLGTGTAPWAPQTFGTSIHLPEVAAGSTAVATSIINHGIGTGEFTFCFYGRIQRVGTGFDGLFAVGSFSPALYISGIGTGSDEWGFWWGSARPSGDILPITTDVVTSIVAMRRAGNLTFFRDGVQTPTTHAVATSLANSAVGLGSDRSGSAANFGNCSVGAFSLHNTAFTDGQVRQWSKDPFGPYTMDPGIRAIPPEVAERGMISVSQARYGGLAGIGGLAGHGGGLAG